MKNVIESLMAIILVYLIISFCLWEHDVAVWPIWARIILGVFCFSLIFADDDKSKPTP